MNIYINDKCVEIENGNIYDAIKAYDESAARQAIAGVVAGNVCELTHPVKDGDKIEILTFDDDRGKKVFWHTASHVLAQAVKELYPGVKLAIGPAIDTGFYYDFDVDEPFNAEDLTKIEAQMKKIVKQRFKMERFEKTVDQALELMKDEPYKQELIKEHAGKGENISFYRQGDFVDLCAGPHLFDVSKIKAFKLLYSTGAYWRGDSNNKMLQRIYGVAFPSSVELNEHLEKLEEARKSDHNKLGRELEYFTTVDIIGQGLPVLLPKGARVVQLLQRFVEDEEQRRGYLLTKTPLMAKSDLFKISGHWDHYLDGMFVIGDPNSDDEVYALRPMTCPFQYQVFLNRMRSYRDLPMRLGETSTLFRNEASGEMHGLIRVRQFTISEGHIICTPEQLEDEFKGCVELAKYMLTCLGLIDDISFRFSKRDPDDKEKYIGTDEQWNEAEGMMEKILNDIGIKYTVGIGEAAFYGPKLDLQIKNVFGKEDTIITIQIDQMLAKNFGMEYVDKDGAKKTPCILHRTSIGCYERTLALMIEKYKGALPTWIAPEQVRILPISEGFQDNAVKVKNELEKLGYRVTCDLRSEKIGYKIREAQMEKVPFMLIIGEKEATSNTVSVRSRSEGDIGAMAVSEFVEMLTDIVDKKA